MRKEKMIMKTNKYIVLLLSVVLAFGACSESYLEQPPDGSVLTQAQYNQLSNTLEGSVRGVYSMLYAVSDHDLFGQRSIDLSTDLLSGDVALTAYSYGWYYVDEQGQTATSRTGYVWSFYYQMMRNINKVVASVNTQGDILKRIAENGLPNTIDAKNEVCYTIVDGDTLATFTATEAAIAGYYAQALTVRGYIYSQLTQLYSATTKVLGSTWKEEEVFPIYNENNFEEAQPLATLEEAYQQVETDLTTAISYFDAFGELLVRVSKLNVDANVARGILAYSYLNKAAPSLPSASSDYTKALKYAAEVIETNEYQVIPNEDVLTNGFNSLDDKSWIWGQDVVIETAGGLASFFGQVDIHSYSYAWAGDVKAIDENLYNEIPEYDIRKKWFNDGSKNPQFKLAPDGKFFSAKNPTSTKDEDLDREWLSDNVFMRIESMYLIAAEASYRLKEYDQSIDYLRGVTDQRVDTTATAASEYATYLSGLSGIKLLQAIEYNWRVEMWGEGYALQTLRRLSSETITDPKGRKRGANHSYEAGSSIDGSASKFIFPIPSSETSYNPHYGTKLPL